METLFTLDKSELYDKIDIVKVRNGLHMVFARFNDFKDLLIFIEDIVYESTTYDRHKVVFDSRKYIRGEDGFWTVIDPSSELGIIMGQMTILK
jgi:hypothetical protein